MLAPLIVAAALSLTTPPANDCTADAHAECVQLIGALYRSTAPDTGRAVRIVAGARWSVEPIAIARLGDRRALIVANVKDDAAHFEGGTWSAYYFAPDAPELLSAARDFLTVGSFGDPGSGAVVALEDGAPALTVAAGGTWQGDSCLWAEIVTLDAAAPRSLITGALVSYQSETRHEGFGADWSELSASGAVLQYTNGRRVSFAPRHGRLEPTTALPRRC